MIALANYMHSHGHDAEHTRPAGIWAKLNTLYNMKTLDEREDAYGDTLLRDSGASTPESNASSTQQTPFYAFQLPEDADMNAMVFDKRLDEDTLDSPSVVKHQLSKGEDERAIAERYSALDTQEYRPRSADALASTVKSSRGGNSKGKAAKDHTRKGSRLKEDSTPKGGTRGRGRKDEDDDDNDDGDDDEEDGDEDGSEEGEEESERGTPKIRGSGRGRGRARGRGRGGRRK